MAKPWLTLEKYCPPSPQPRQREFLNLWGREAFYGGAAGGGKSWALLMGALMYADTPKYEAIIFRRTAPQLTDLIKHAREWLDGKARWHGTHNRWTFSSGATLTFGHMQYADDVLKFKGPSFQYIGFDELSEFDNSQYLYMFSRMRRPSCHHRLTNPNHDNKNCKICKAVAPISVVPLRMRSTSNPDGPGRLWVRDRMVSDEAMEAIADGKYHKIFYNRHREGPDKEEIRIPFVPSLIEDNYGLDQGEYIEYALAELDPITRDRLRKGDWRISESAILKLDRVHEFTMRGQIIEPRNKQNEIIGEGIDERECVRFTTVDTAGTSKQREEEKRPKNPNKSWSVCAVWDYWPVTNFLFLRHVWRDQVEFTDLVDCIIDIDRRWKPECNHVEDAHFGPALTNTLEKNHRVTVRLVSTHTKGDRGQSGTPGKVERSAELQKKMERGEFFVPRFNNDWLPQYLGELLTWTGRKNEPDDQIDVSSHAANLCEDEYGGVSTGMSERPFWR